ncbi:MULTISPECIES: histidine phosphatase family protein [Halomonadaceae]|uniref:phosphoglycerate mutase (2,3-diphosphoglycerate-dependent) n=1 Tax=Vreelandella titanicae TaxID=664683 RepID=A0AAP9NIU3_9GAMM|nr:MULTISPECIES: histidine phosphatase family protein [Halomonas]QKS22862.1 2,3-bisphosphoglycerate-dependent phosphoglycerate mutase [Halomonas titanicae]SDI19220.1 2,3-bisphosphoglycerate-dependent phosphoglycerate mutase [Halomonas titanicae]
MVALALIRHGEYSQLADTPSALQPYPLTEKGAADVREQARQFGAWLATSGYQLNAEIHCSTLLRAWQTAEIFREELTPLFAEPPCSRSFSALCERSVGALANLSIQEIERLVALDPRLEPLPKGWKSASDFRLPFDGAESLLEAGARVAAHLQALLDIPPRLEGAKRLQLVVGHGASIRHASYHLNVIPFSDIKRLSMFHGHPVVFERHNQGWHRLYGNWKQRQPADPLD